MRERVLFQNEACLVLNKLPGESSELFVERELFQVHRLDTPVSGCLLLAKNQEAAAFLGAAFTRSECARPEIAPSDESLKISGVEKQYWAIIEKTPKEFPAEAELIHWVYENKELNKSFTVSWEEGKAPQKRGYAPPKKAVLRYRVTGQGTHYIFLEIDLVTGRHHQIRAQLAALGLHIKGDLKYGAKRSEKGGGLRLHARSLAFPNPLNPGEIIYVTADPPVLDSLWLAFIEAVSAGS